MSKFSNSKQSLVLSPDTHQHLTGNETAFSLYRHEWVCVDIVTDSNLDTITDFLCGVRKLDQHNLIEYYGISQ